MSNDRQKTWTGERLETFVFTENTNEHLHRYAMALELTAGKKVLDIACGEGYGTALLATVASHVHGVDIDADTVQHANTKYKAANLSFATGSADAIPCPDHEFDLIVSFETIEHHDRHDAMMQEIKRVLKPGGILIISSPDKMYYSDATGYKNPFHIKELYKDEFENLVSKYFTNANFYAQRSFNGSVVIALNNKGIEEDKLYSGGYEQITGSGIQAMYCIAVASDNGLPATRNSLFDGTNVFNKQIGGLIAARAAMDIDSRMAQSWRYRIGSIVLWPLSTIKKILRA